MPSPVVGAVFSPPQQQQQVIPEVVPMRRGRPTAGSQAHAPKPSPSPMRGTASDPFAALDGKPQPMQVDELSNRFPSLDQFSLLHDGGKFDFNSSPPPHRPSQDLGQRVTEKLADDAFAASRSKTPMASTATASPAPTPIPAVSRAQKIISSNPELQSVTSPPSVVYQPTPTRAPNSTYVSTGTMTSPTPPAVYRLSPDHHRSVSLPRPQEAATSKNQHLRPASPSRQPGALHRNPSYGSQSGHPQHPSSSRPSLEGGRPTSIVLEPVIRTKSSNAQSRPTSAYLESNIDYLREKESRGRKSTDKRPTWPVETTLPDPNSDEDTNIESNVQFLRAMEDQETSKKDLKKEAKKDRRRSSGANNKSKRSSMPSMSLSGTKTLLAGKFGDAFKRFENNASAPPGPRTPSPLQEMERRDLTPIAGSEATDGRSDDGNIVDEVNMTQEQRRELERRRLSMEEKRVADAAAEYRKRLAENGSGPAPRSIGGISRAASIQNKVKNLLDESSQPSPVKKTAEGYGRFTESMSAPQPSHLDQYSNPYAKPHHPHHPHLPHLPHLPNLPRKPHVQGGLPPRSVPAHGEISYQKPRTQPITPPATISKTGGPRPSAPPKPMHLNSISTGPQHSPPQPALPARPIQARPDMTQQEKEDYIVDFSRRFPSLSGIEMVEREIEMDNGKRDDGRARSKVV